MIHFQTLNNTFSYEQRDIGFVNLLNAQNPNKWRGELPSPPFVHGDRTKRDNLKNEIKEKLLTLQGKHCIYCGARFRSNSDIQREHILPKETYPIFTFEPYNLVLACWRCNGFDFKGTKDYAIRPVCITDYRQNNFLIVHPYLDNLFDHIDTSSVVLQVVNNSEKGQYTINEFGLNDEYNILLRSRFVNRFEDISLDGVISDSYHYSS